MGDPFFMLQFYFMLRGQVQQRSLENLGLGPILISGGIKNRHMLLALIESVQRFYLPNILDLKFLEHSCHTIYISIEVKEA